MVPARRPPGLGFILGLWLGSTIAVVACISYNFIGIPHAVELNPKLQEEADLTPEAARGPERREHPIYVYAGELNRATFFVWNRAQLALAGLALLLSFVRPRAFVSLALLIAGGIVVALTFYVAPEVTELGRQLDFQLRPEPGTNDVFDRFDLLHKSATILEGTKTVLVLLAGLALLPSGAAPAAKDSK